MESRSGFVWCLTCRLKPCCHSQFQVHGIREWKEAPQTGTEVDSVRHLRYTEGFGGKITNMFVQVPKMEEF